VLVLLIIKIVIGRRAPVEGEELGIDETEHAETAYDLASVGVGIALSMAGREA
jgi:ammonium transporter, Amt family